MVSSDRTYGVAQMLYIISSLWRQLRLTCTRNSSLQLHVPIPIVTIFSIEFFIEREPHSQPER